MERESYERAATDLNEKLALVPALDLTVSDEQLVQSLKKAAELVVATDRLDDSTWRLLEECEMVSPQILGVRKTLVTKVEEEKKEKEEAKKKVKKKTQEKKKEETIGEKKKENNKGIGALTKEMLKKYPKKSNNEIVEMINAKLGTSTTRTAVAWYRNKMKKDA